MLLLSGHQVLIKCPNRQVMCQLRDLSAGFMDKKEKEQEDLERTQIAGKLKDSPSTA